MVDAVTTGYNYKRNRYSTGFHNIEFSCLQKCLFWNLNLVSRINKFCYRNLINGKYKSSIDDDDLIKYNNINLREVLPVDLSLAQQFVFDKNSEKIKFSLDFDMNFTDSVFKNVYGDYTHYNYELILNVKIKYIKFIGVFAQDSCPQRQHKLYHQGI